MSGITFGSIAFILKRNRFGIVAKESTYTGIGCYVCRTGTSIGIGWRTCDCNRSKGDGKRGETEGDFHLLATYGLQVSTVFVIVIEKEKFATEKKTLVYFFSFFLF